MYSTRSLSCRVAQCRKSPWYVIRMPGGVRGELREGLPYSISFLQQAKSSWPAFACHDEWSVGTFGRWYDYRAGYRTDLSAPCPVVGSQHGCVTIRRLPDRPRSRARTVVRSSPIGTMALPIGFVPSAPGSREQRGPAAPIVPQGDIKTA